MSNVYIVSTSPFPLKERKKETLEKYQEYITKTGYLALGWANDLGDFREISDGELKNNNLSGRVVKDIRRFSDMKKGALIIAPFSTNYPLKFVGKAVVGILEEPYNGPKNENFNEFGLRQLVRVKWIQEGQKLFDFSNDNNLTNCLSFKLRDFWFPGKYKDTDSRKASSRFKMEDELKRIISKHLKIKESTYVVKEKIMSKNILLYGPPGTGKTFNTKRLAVEIISDANKLT